MSCWYFSSRGNHFGSGGFSNFDRCNFFDDPFANQRLGGGGPIDALGVRHRQNLGVEKSVSVVSFVINRLGVVLEKLHSSIHLSRKLTASCDFG